MIRESIAEVPGAALRYRLAGTPSRLPLIVLENGWLTSYDYFTLLQDALAPHTQVLLYNRAGIGGSVARESLSAEGMSRHLAALLDALGIEGPVVVAGQSYGGLICGVHAALMPERLLAIAQIDATPDRADPQTDFAMATMSRVGRLMKLLARLRIPEPFFSRGMGELPSDDIDRLRRHSLRSAASITSAISELDLLSQIREVCARPSATPRLVISADRIEEITGPMSKLVSAERARAVIPRMQAHHQATAARGGPGSLWIMLPYTHGSLVMSRAGAAETVARIFAFLNSLQKVSA